MLWVNTIYCIKVDLNEKLDRIILLESNQFTEDHHYDRLYINALYFIEHCECLNIQWTFTGSKYTW